MTDNASDLGYWADEIAPEPDLAMLLRRLISAYEEMPFATRYILDDTINRLRPFCRMTARKIAEQRAADRIDGYDRDDLGESPDY